MRALVFLLSTAVILLLGCGHPSSGAETTGSAVPLSFYIVSETRIEGWRFIDTLDFPKLGYIASTPDLVVTRLEDVVPDHSRREDIMVDPAGKITRMPSRPGLIIRMCAEDARKFSTLTEQAIGKRVLLMLGDTPLIAPVVRDSISTPSLSLTLGEDTEAKKIEDELKKLLTPGQGVNLFRWLRF